MKSTFIILVGCTINTGTGFAHMTVSKCSLMEDSLEFNHIDKVQINLKSKKKQLYSLTRLDLVYSINVAHKTDNLIFTIQGE